MDKKIQNLAWACLPKEAREEIKQWYSNCGVINHLGISYIDGFSAALRNVFSENNLTSDTEPEGEAFIIPVEQVRETYAYNELILKHDPHHKGAQMLQSYLLQTFGDKCLPDKEPSVRVEPKFKVGDKVRVIDIEEYAGEVTEIIAVDKSDPIAPYKLDLLDDEGGGIWCDGNAIEPYTEPEKGNNEEISGNYSKIPNQSNDNMEEKELNLIGILKDCPVGERFFSLIVGDVTFEGIDSHWEQEVFKPIICTGGNYNADGTYTEPSDNGVCCLYPSRALYEKYPLDPYSAWMEWKDSRKPKRWRAKNGESYWFFDRTYTPYQQEENDDIEDEIMYDAYNYFHTEEEAQQAADGVREYLLNFHKQNK